LIKGSNGFRDYSTANLSSPQILNLARIIEYYVDEEMEKSNPAGAPARAEIYLKDGSIHERTVQFAKGTIQHLMTKNELENKFRELTATLLTKQQSDDIIDIVDELEKLDNLQELSLLLTPDAFRSQKNK
jgi:2-methylcitrate dehydratase PrpD